MTLPLDPALLAVHALGFVLRKPRARVVAAFDARVRADEFFEACQSIASTSPLLTKGLIFHAGNRNVVAIDNYPSIVTVILPPPNDPRGRLESLAGIEADNVMYVVPDDLGAAGMSMVNAVLECCEEGVVHVYAGAKEDALAL